MSAAAPLAQGARFLRVTHDTHYTYDGRVTQSQHLAHLKPVSNSTQLLQSFRLQIDPQPLVVDESLDSFGNALLAFNLETPHEELFVRAQSLLQLRVPAAPRTGGQAWEDVREALVYRAGWTFDAATEFVFASEYVPRHPELAAYAAISFKPRRLIIDAAWELSQRIYREFTYTPESTEVNTPALDALRGKCGVCQDFAHVMIGALRSIGLAAKYVSGYLMTQPPPGKPRLIGSDASHAWVAVYLGGGDWLELCPTNDRAPGNDYVTLAYGRDYTDIAPLRGVLRGSGEHALKVGVTVEEV